MSTPDTSSDDATLAAAEKWLDTLSYITLGDGDDHVRDVVAIARRLQGEKRDVALARDDWHRRNIKAEAELRELRATIAAVTDALGYVRCEFFEPDKASGGDLCRIPFAEHASRRDAKHKFTADEDSLAARILNALADATTGDKT